MEGNTGVGVKGEAVEAGDELEAGELLDAGEVVEAGDDVGARLGVESAGEEGNGDGTSLDG